MEVGRGDPTSINMVQQYETRLCADALFGRRRGASSSAAAPPPAPTRTGLVLQPLRATTDWTRTWDPVVSPDESQGVWARPAGPTREQRAAALERERRIAHSEINESSRERGARRGDCQHGVIPKGENPPTPPERPSPGQDTSEVSGSEKPQLVPKPPNQPPPAEMSRRPSLLEDCRRTPPQPPQDNAVSPSEVDPAVFHKQGEEAEQLMQSFREMIRRLEDKLEGAQPDTQVRIREQLVEFATKIRETARVQNIAECRLEVAAPLYLIFKMIIPVM